jgi:hypothetical protein
VSTDPKSGADRGDQLFNSFVRSNEPPKPPASPPPDGGAGAPGGKAPDTAPPAPAPGAYMSCSECRAPMRDRYFALNERPICAKCRPAFVKRIERGTGQQALQRAFFHGFGVALLGALVLGTGVLFIPFVRIFVVIGVGHYVGKTIMRAVDGYGGRRYQYLAVGLTYFSIGLGSLIPAINEAREAEARHAAIMADTTRRLANQGRAIAEELDSWRAEQQAEQAAMAAEEGTPEEAGDSTAAAEAADTSVVAAEKPAAAKGFKRPRITDYLIAMVILPVLAMFAFGYMAAGVGLFTLAFALREAWKQTDGQGLELVLTGPFKVGTGPIAATG